MAQENGTDDDIDKLPVSEEDMQHVTEVFRKVDKDGNGKITKEELRQASHILRYNPTQAQLQRMIDFVETDREGEINFKEFAQLMREHFGTPESEEEAVVEALKKMFKNERVNAEELKAGLQRKGDDPLSEEEVQSIFEEFDLNSDGVLDINELARLLCRK